MEGVLIIYKLSTAGKRNFWFKEFHYNVAYAAQEPFSKRVFALLIQIN